jgi:hypothetical protein
MSLACGSIELCYCVAFASPIRSIVQSIVQSVVRLIGRVLPFPAPDRISRFFVLLCGNY